jgi:hypothetical protein
MRIIIELALGALALGPASAANADFSWELTGRADRGESDDFDSDNAGVSATYYFDPVEDGDGPHSVAVFLDPATRVSVTGNKNEFEEHASTLGLRAETTQHGFSGQYLLPQSHWYVGGRYSQSDSDEPIQAPVTASSTDERAYGVVAGKYLNGDRTRIELALERSDADTDIALNFCLLPACFGATATAEATRDETRLSVMHVARVRSATYALRGSAIEISGQAVAQPPVFTGPLIPPIIVPTTPSVFDLGDFRAYSAGVELFPLQQLGVRFDYTRFGGDSPLDDAVDVGVGWFFRRNLGLELTLSREESDDSSESLDRAALRVIGRLR